MSIDSHDSQFSTNDSRRYRPGMDRKDIREKEQSDRDRHQSLPIRSWGTRTIAAFEIIEIIGAGTYADVFSAKDRQTGEIVALKKIKMRNENEGFPITAIREIKILKQLHHPNIINLKEIVVGDLQPSSSDPHAERGGIFMVFEYMPHDLTGLVDQSPGKYFEEAHVKCYIKQLLEGLHYCHVKQILHRDIKGSNLLINDKGELKLADFGLARPKNLQFHAAYTNRVITLWYRPPELLFGAIHYDGAVDMWSVGCIMAELLARKPIFPGRNEVDQIELITKLCGSPTPESWPSLFLPNRDEIYPWFKLIPQQFYPSRMAEGFRKYSPTAYSLIESLLQLDPSRRITADKALDHDWFWTDPMPAHPSTLPKYPPCHEYSVRKRSTRPQGGPRPPSPKNQRQASHPDPTSSSSSSSSSSSNSTSTSQGPR